jgi:hypothetical protein
MRDHVSANELDYIEVDDFLIDCVVHAMARLREAGLSIVTASRKDC